MLHRKPSLSGNFRQGFYLQLQPVVFCFQTLGKYFSWIGYILCNSYMYCVIVLQFFVHFTEIYSIKPSLMHHFIKGCIISFVSRQTGICDNVNNVFFSFCLSFLYYMREGSQIRVLSLCGNDPMVLWGCNHFVEMI